MKKHYPALLSALLICLLLFSACSAIPANSSFIATSSAFSPADTSASESVSASSQSLPDKEALYAQVAQTNTIDNILAQHESLSQDIIYYDEVSGDYSIFVYADENMMAQEDSKDNVLLMQKDGSCGFDAEMNTAYRHLFVGKNIYQDYWEGTRQFILFTNDWGSGESVTDLTLDGEFYRLTTETPSEDVEGDSIINVYIIDPQTLFVQSTTCSQKHSDGSSQLVCECTLHYNAEPYEPSSVLLQQAYGKGRIVTVIADPDTENEQTYSVEVLPGISVQITMDSCYSTLFEDRACTVAHQTEDNDLSASCTYYVSAGK